MMPPSRPAMKSPDANALARSESFTQHLAQKIQQHGPMPFSEYMELCLYHPEWGYYSGRSAIFGEQGDFVTAPEVSDLFAIGLAKHIAAVVAEARSNANAGGVFAAGVEIIEIGAGSGRLAQDLLAALKAEDCALSSYRILERSKTLQQRQNERLAEAMTTAGVQFAHVTEIPPGFNGVVIANEVLDALAVERIMADGRGLHRLLVDWNGEQLVLIEGQLSGDLQALAEERLGAICQQIQEEDQLPGAPGRYITELHHQIQPWLSSTLAPMERGMVLLVDYGYPRHEYYHPQRRDGSLMCYFQHQGHDDALRWPGLQDITAFVDFTTVAEVADAQGWTMAGYTSQSHFLLSSGVLQALEQLEDPAEMAMRAEQVRRLMLPGEMGERFQVMQLSRGIAAVGPGFEVDLSYRL